MSSFDNLFPKAFPLSTWLYLFLFYTLSDKFFLRILYIFLSHFLQFLTVFNSTSMSFNLAIDCMRLYEHLIETSIHFFWLYLPFSL